MYDLKALYEAESVAHAIQLLQEHPEAQIIAGGSDVLVQMREGRRAGKELVSIYKIDEMRGISYEEDGAIRIGSLTSFSHITRIRSSRSISTYLGKLLIWLVDHRSVTSERSVETHVMVLHPLIPLQHFMHGMQLLRSQDRTEFAESRSMTSILKQESLI